MNKVRPKVQPWGIAVDIGNNTCCPPLTVLLSLREICKNYFMVVGKKKVTILIWLADIGLTISDTALSFVNVVSSIQAVVIYLYFNIYTYKIESHTLYYIVI